jgi:hypothetical protein
MKPKWESYERVATELLNKFASDFGLSRVEGKQSILGNKSGTNWEIDAKGFREGNDAIVIVECRRFTTSKQSQERLASLAYRIIDTGADGGIIVSPLGLQSGAQYIANAENIINVKLDKNSTPTEFSMQFLNKIFVGIHEHVELIDKCDAVLTRICNKCNKSFIVQNDEKMCPTCTEIFGDKL